MDLVVSFTSGHVGGGGGHDRAARFDLGKEGWDCERKLGFAQSKPMMMAPADVVPLLKVSRCSPWLLSQNALLETLGSCLPKSNDGGARYM